MVFTEREATLILATLHYACETMSTCDDDSLWKELNAIRDRFINTYSDKDEARTIQREFCKV